MDREQRRSNRLDLKLTGKLKDGKLHRADVVTVKNFSSEGACLLTPRAIQIGHICKVGFQRSQNRWLNIQARVVWQGEQQKVNGGANKVYPTGVNFLVSNDEEHDEIRLLLRRSLPLSAEAKETLGQGWKFPRDRFVLKKRVLLKHSNLEGNTYYDNYITWQGEARESLLLSHPNVAQFLMPENFVKMITHSLGQQYMRDTFFGNEIRIEVTSKEVKHCSFRLIFRFYDEATNNLIGEGWQKICFANGKTQKICEIPNLILDLIEPIEEDKR